MKSYDVVVVGLGPVGGTIANLLALNGLSILILEREKNIYAEQARQSGKPEEIIKKMIEGRMNKYFQLLRPDYQLIHLYRD